MWRLDFVRARLRRALLLALGSCCAALVGCGPTAPLERAGVSLTTPAGWRPTAPTAWPVPGVPLAAWRGPGEASLVVYRSLPAPGFTAESLGRSLAIRLENMPGLTIKSSTTAEVGGMTAARVEAVAPGLGGSFAPTGLGQPTDPEGRPLLPTRRVALILPRAADTIHLLWHAPEDAAEALHAQVAATLKSLRIDRRQLATSSY